MAAVDISELLARLQLFSGLTPSELRPLAARCRLRVLNAGERLTAGDDLLAVNRGLMRVTGSINDAAVSWLSAAGQFFGSLDVRLRRKPPLEAVALMPTELLVIPQAAFERFVADTPKAMRAALNAMAEKLQEERELRSLMHLSSADRMLGALVFLYHKIGARIPLTRAGIAEMTGLARETSIRSLSPFEKRGLIRTRRGVIEVLKPAELEQALQKRLASYQ